VGEQIFVDVFDAEIVLTDSVRTMILLKHPEVAGFIERVESVLADPDEVHQSVRDTRSVLSV
jgi:hypothetical protein